jgi:hypothetical protein
MEPEGSVPYLQESKSQALLFYVSWYPISQTLKMEGHPL